MIVAKKDAESSKSNVSKYNNESACGFVVLFSLDLAAIK